MYYKPRLRDKRPTKGTPEELIVAHTAPKPKRMPRSFKPLNKHIGG